MKSRAFCFTLLATIAISVAVSVPAQAQRARVFVAVTGNDANPCTAQSPCKTFQHAHDVVQAGGEISVLDTGGYGTLTISKAVSIVATGVEASIATGAGATAITINAGSSDKVSLRGLTLDGAGVGQTGVVFNSGESLTMENCAVRNFTFDGLDFVSTAATTQTLAVSNSFFNDNSDVGIAILTKSTGPIAASIDRSGFFDNNAEGLYIDGSHGTGPLSVGVKDSVSTNNSVGFFVTSGGGRSVTNLSLTHSLAEGNSFGVEALQINATLWLAHSTVTGNANGFTAGDGGVINSFGDNYITDGTNSGTLTSIARR
jgi:hypothetical protein